MKKNRYIAPAVEQMDIEMEARLLDASITGTADSRTGFSVWNVLGF